ncbi:DUF6287 domain-containing protein [Streptococcus loxodontisalivarius]|uniref:DUF6287 domain-containing protein n=1 Tax=Streptococcus loxodontisalivarius TaxID=1349415 RepID=A0ABS2PUS2_9STRE|nr:DUF6287 domain-containing protein [Streptococcus loxodontisalivarius]MBM7643688.1 hypothetical protein [Streptococcus loxodontisalivarius]
MKKKLMTVLSLTLSASLLVACGQSKKSEEKSSQTSQTTETTTTTEKVKTDETQYETVLETYRSAIANKATSESVNSLIASYGSGMVSATYDFDKNGVNELVIASNSYGAISIFDIYTINSENKLVRLTNAENKLNMIGERMTLTPREDGTFFYHGSGGANTGGNAIYTFAKDGASLEKTAEVSYDFSVSEGYTDEKTGQVYSKDEYQAKFEASPALDLKTWTWTSLTQPSSSTTSAKTETKRMDVDAIVSGDYSSVAGTWSRADYSMTFDVNGLAVEGVTLTPTKLANGAVRINVATPASGYLIYMIPAGVSVDATDASDTTKDRMWSGQNEVFSDPSGFFYKQ